MRGKMRRPSGDCAIPSRMISCVGFCVMSWPSKLTVPERARGDRERHGGDRVRMAKCVQHDRRALVHECRESGMHRTGRASGLACVGDVQCVWWPRGPRAAASRARSSHTCSSSPAPRSGGRMSAAIAKPPGRRACSAENRAHTSSASGRSTWQETTAYRFRLVCGISGLVSPAAPADQPARH